MQKFLNLLFILILITISTILPLNTALIKIEPFRPIVDPNSEDNPHEIEQISFIGIKGISLASVQDFPSTYWVKKNPEEHLLGVVGFDEDSAIKKLSLLYQSSTGDFTTDFPELSLAIEGQDPIAISPKYEDLIIDGKQATYVLPIEDNLPKLADGYYNADFLVGTQKAGKLIISAKKNRQKKLLEYRTDIPEDYRVYEFFCPDKERKQLIPVSRLVPKSTFNYITLYDTMVEGASPSIELAEQAIPVSNEYWIESGTLRVMYLSSNIQDERNIELIYEAVARTFASYSNIVQTTIFLDGVHVTMIETPKTPAIYTPYQNGGTYTYITKKPAVSKTIDELIKEFLTDPAIAGIIPPLVELEHCELDDQGELAISITNYHYIQDKELFDVLLNLTAYSLDGVESLLLNGEVQPKIQRYNIEP